MGRPEKTIEQRFELDINKSSGQFWNNTECWKWIGALDKDGYGKLSIRRDGKSKHWRAHRWVYSLYKELQEGPLDHLCQNKTCVNPDHLEHVTTRVNNLRSDGPSGVNARKAFCVRGHAFTVDNTYHDGRGWRQCRRCNRIRQRNRRYANLS